MKQLVRNSPEIFTGLILTFIALLSFSCTTIPMYVPNTIQTPVFNDKNELHLSAFLGLNGYNFQSSYLLSKNIGFFGGYSFMKPEAENEQKFHEHNFIEG